jgi:hypothetical protein
MSRNRWRFSKSTIAIGVFGLAVGLLAGLTALITGKPATGRGMWLVDDWTHHHLVFSNPGTAADALAQGRFEQWYKITNDPRYIMQQMKRNPMQRALATAPDFATLAARLSAPFGGRGPIGPPPWRNPKQSLKKDWSTGMLSGVAASQTGTVTSNGASGSSTVTVGGQILMGSAPVAAARAGTFSGYPLTSDAITVVDGANTLTLKTGGTDATATGTFSGTPSASTTITITSGTNTLTLSNGGTVGSYSLVFSGTATSTGSISIQYTGGTSSNTLVMSPVTSGSNTCTSAAAGTFVNSTSSTTRATNFNTAIGACHTSYSAIGVTSGRSSSTDTLTADLPGNFLTVTNSLTNTTGSGVLTAGTNGSNICSSSTLGKFATSSTPATLASNLYTAINACNGSYSAVRATASYTSGTSFTVTATVPGTAGAFGGSGITGIFAWSGVTAGVNGSNSCPASTTGTYAMSTTLSTLAANLNTVINTCTSADGVTSANTSGSTTVTLTARAAGTDGNSITLTSTNAFFAWAGGALAGGSDGTPSGTTFPYWLGSGPASAAQLAINIAATINANTTLQGSTGVTAGVNSATITVTARTSGTAGNSIGTTASLTGFGWGGTTLGGGATGTVQPNMFPAKFGASLTSASCANDFVVYPTGTAGSSGAANIIAYYNLYTTGCSGTVPQVYWAYNTGGTVTTSPIISYDSAGSQVAFIQVSGTTASLVLLKWAPTSGTLTSPVAPTSESTASDYRSCTAPCMYAFSLSANDTFSAPFYDYNGDAIYVGDDSGKLHKITGVFNGTTIAEASAFPVTLTSGNKVSSPVYDATYGYVEVGDFAGYFYFVTASSGAVQKTGSFGDVIADAPLVDGSDMITMAFVTTGGSSYGNGTNSVVEFDTGYGVPTGPSGYVSVGTGGAGYYLYAGAFDNVYYQTTTRNVTGAGGNLYVLGNTGATTGATLYQVTMTGNSSNTQAWISGTNTAVTGISFSGTGATRPFPSPVTEFCNGACGLNAGQTATASGSTDYLFFSVNRGNKTSCTTTAGNGCILSYNISTPTPTTSITQAGSGLNVTTPGTNGCWATGGLVIDNSSTTTGASQIYFVNLDGNAAGGPTGTTPTSSNCTAGTGQIINATQASQASP